MTPLYPLKFIPILNDRILGGEKLKQVLKKKTTSKTVGESWEISTIPDKVSVVANGSLKGKTLQELINQYPSLLLGTLNAKTYGKRFPLLIKFIDAKQNLSLQVHPNNQLASIRHNSFGKTEMWYVMQADKNATLVLGFNQKLNKEKYLSHLKSNTISALLNFEKVKAGDSFFIEAGQIHAIGKGLLLAEIQQASDITYRIFDWDRVDKHGQPRELHNALAMDAINFKSKNNHRLNYKTTKNKANVLISNPCFTTNYIEVDTTIRKKNDGKSFLIYICIEGCVEIQANTFLETVSVGETILVPACISEYRLVSQGSKLLEISVL